ncbi:hypothetical protein ACEQ8H_004915 [Pleosporales sp. CAS-2024a]
MARDTPMQSLLVEFGLPVQPRPHDEASESTSCQIYLTQTCDTLQFVKLLVDPIDDELQQLPYANTDPTNVTNASPGSTAQNVAVIYITQFFTDGRDFAYYILGLSDVERLDAGMNVMQAYAGPVTATPIFSENHGFLRGQDRRVNRSNSPMEAMRWNYLYETARIAWSKLSIDAQRVEQIKSRNARDAQVKKPNHTQLLPNADD